jgi:hypothetical protein
MDSLLVHLRGFARYLVTGRLGESIAARPAGARP